MKNTFLCLVIVSLVAATASAQEISWPPKKQNEQQFTGRLREEFKHGTRAEWGYPKPQQDTFLLLHPKEKITNAPLLVVLHSAGTDVHSTCNGAPHPGGELNRTPQDFFGLYLNCRKEKDATDRWWGSRNNGGSGLSPTDKRVMDTVKWVMKQYGVDENRVYLCGISMGGSGAWGIGMRQGDVFAAFRATVRSRMYQFPSRMYLAPETVPTGTRLPDPPIAVDFSAQNDGNSGGHEVIVKNMIERKYALIQYWGPSWHSSNLEEIRKVNDLTESFDWLSVRKNELYPVFTDASSNDPLPWPDKTKETKAGQINAFFRWKEVKETPDTVAITLFLVTPADLKTTFTIPTESTADVSLRRLQSLRVKPGDTVRWTFGTAGGEIKADAAGLITIPKLKITEKPVSLSIRKVK